MKKNSRYIKAVRQGDENNRKDKGKTRMKRGRTYQMEQSDEKEEIKYGKEKEKVKQKNMQNSEKWRKIKWKETGNRWKILKHTNSKNMKQLKIYIKNEYQNNTHKHCSEAVWKTQKIDMNNNTETKAGKKNLVQLGWKKSRKELVTEKKKLRVYDISFLRTLALLRLIDGLAGRGKELPEHMSEYKRRS